MLGVYYELGHGVAADAKRASAYDQKGCDGGETDGVDYDAKTSDENGRRRFVASENEERGPEWKMCYRAGREACEAARAFGLLN